MTGTTSSNMAAPSASNVNNEVMTGMLNSMQSMQGTMLGLQQTVIKLININDKPVTVGVDDNNLSTAYAAMRNNDLGPRPSTSSGAESTCSQTFPINARAAAALRDCNIKVDWSIKDTTMLSMVAGNAKVNSCSNCVSTMHLSSFCPHIQNTVTNKVANTANYSKSSNFAVKDLDRYDFNQREKVDTPINVDELKQQLHNHPDKQFVNYLCHGLAFGFDTLISNTDVPTKECRNLRSAITQPDIVDKLIESEVNKGFLEGPFEELHFQQYRVSPIGVAIGKYSGKPRLIVVDLSSPHENIVHQSVNDMIDKDSCSLSYVRIDDAIQIIQNLGRYTTMCKTDISDAIKLMPVLPLQWHMFCIKWRTNYYFYTKLAFGCRSSPRIFDNLSQAVCWIAKNNFGIEFILHLLDDFITFEHPHKCGQRNMDLLYYIFDTLKILMAKHKTSGPDTVIEYLGIILDSNLMEARLPNDKLIRISTFLKEFLIKKSCTKREVLQLLGHLNFASRVVIPGRTFVSHLILVSTTVKALHHYIKLTCECREDIRIWLFFLSNWNGVSMFYNKENITSDDLCLYTDASGSIGFGGYYKGLWFAESWPSMFSNLVVDEKEVSIAFRELYPIVVSAVLWGHMWKKQRIIFMCDNEATVAILKKGRSKSAYIMPLVRRLTLIAAQQNFVFLSKHVPGKFNSKADALSRLQINKFRRLAKEAQEFPCIVPPPQLVLWSSTP
ncbi:Hypothetical predicted protein [Mytilus galloprovincialis]|uniref:Reverse transcriptase domain-containing protein n=1 Tax=Mytilus galloprovincialis TaxID=29158 RepID=A0A8B6EUT5_MYTGA|nr:Hypothetical predicted protein [Mytilus galloprovincialis]